MLSYHGLHTGPMVSATEFIGKANTGPGLGLLIVQEEGAIPVLEADDPP